MPFKSTSGSDTGIGLKDHSLCSASTNKGTVNAIGYYMLAHDSRRTQRAFPPLMRARHWFPEMIGIDDCSRVNRKS